MRVGERDRGTAPGAFGEQPADVPVGPAAAGAEVHFALAIDDGVAADGGAMRIAFTYPADDGVEHRGISLGDAPLAAPAGTVRGNATATSQASTGLPGVR